MKECPSCKKKFRQILKHISQKKICSEKCTKKEIENLKNEIGIPSSKERKQKSRLKERKNLKAERQGNFLNHQKKLSRSQKNVKQMEEK